MCKRQLITDQPAFTDRTVSAVCVGDFIGTVNDLAGPPEDSKDFRNAIKKLWPDFVFREHLNQQATKKRLLSEFTEAAANVGPDGMLLVIMDICHAESATRNGFKKRSIGYDKVLVFSSSLSTQTSSDAQFPGGANGAWHYSLEKTLVKGITYLQWFIRAKELLKKLGFDQTPVIEGPEHLQSRLVFEGNVEVIEISTHGGQIPDKNGDEPDKKDEVIYLYDGYVVDDEIRAIIEAADKRMNKRIIFERIFKVSLKTSKMKRSIYKSLNGADFLKGLLIAFLTALFTGLLQLFEAGPFVFDWPTFQPIVYAAVGAALSYIIKNYFTNSTGDLLKKELK